MKKVKKIGVLSLGKILGIIYIIFGFIFGAIISLLSVLGTAFYASENINSSLMFSVGAIIFFPIVFGISGLILGFLTGWIFNLAAKWAGGLEIEIKDNTENNKIIT